MVRVNGPPGGETKFNGETKPPPQTVRVLKPPGGGSSINFAEDEDAIEISRRPKSLPTSAAASPTETSPTENKVTNGAAESPKENAPSDTKSTPAVETPAAETNGTSQTETTSTVATPSTPPSGRPEKDTKNRLFGEDNSERGTPNRQVKDRMRSSIFQGDESKTADVVATTNGNSKNAVPVKKPENDKPEPEPVKSAPTRQRVPPGGFSTKLW